MPRSAKSVSEAQALIKPLVGKPITNEKLGITATISGNSLGKFGSQKATEKSVSPALHAKAIANIDVLFQNAEFDVMHPDEKNIYEVGKIHRLGSLMFDEASEKYVPVMITVKEFNNPKGNRIYSIEAVDIEIKEKPAGQLVVDRQSPLQQTPIAGLTNHDNKETAIADFNTKVQQLIETVKRSEEKDMESVGTVCFHSEYEDAADFGEYVRPKHPKPVLPSFSGENLKQFSLWSATRTDLMNERLGAIARAGELTALQKIEKSLEEQKTTFEESSKAISDFVLGLLNSSVVSQMTKTDLGKILREIREASTKTNLLNNLKTVYDIVLDKQIKTSKSIFGKYLTLKVSGKSQAGVSVARMVDDDTRVVIETVRKYFGAGVSDITDEVVKLTDKKEEEKDEFRIRQLDNRLMGLNIARRYASTVSEAMKNVAEIEQGINEERDKIRLNQDEKRDKNGKRYFAAKEGKLPEIRKSRSLSAGCRTFFWGGGEGVE
jgi:hypothetical protein